MDGQDGRYGEVSRAKLSKRNKSEERFLAALENDGQRSLLGHSDFGRARSRARKLDAACRVKLADGAKIRRRTASNLATAYA